MLPVKCDRNPPDVFALVDAKEIENASFGSKTDAQLVVYFDVRVAVDLFSLTLGKVERGEVDVECDESADACSFTELAEQLWRIKK